MSESSHMLVAVLFGHFPLFSIRNTGQRPKRAVHLPGEILNLIAKCADRSRITVTCFALLFTLRFEASTGRRTILNGRER
jgi:hypothetical protein